MKRAGIAVTLVLGWFAPLALGGDWPQWLGPSRDAVSDETGLLASWPKTGPKKIWTYEVGPGFSGPVVSGERLVIFHFRDKDKKEIIDCLHAGTGKKIWTLDYPCAYEDSFGKGNGPRSTPAIAGSKVIALGAEGTLTCVDLDSGKKLWQRPLHKEYEVPPSFFGVGTSPVVSDDLVLVNVGGKDAGIVAFALDTGKEVWRATQDPASYSSPVVRTVADKKLAFFFTRTGIVILEAKTGKVDFQMRWRSPIDASVNAATPLVIGDLVFYSASYQTGAILLRLSKGSVEEVWKGENIMSNHYNTCVHYKGHLYGFDGRQEAGPSLRCVELATGKVLWDKKRFGCGSMILAAGKLLILTEAGELILVDANPAAYRELARASVLEATPCRAQIALSDGRLFARDQRKLVCFQLKK